MPEMLLSASSSGSTTAVAISAGLAPGSCTLTVTVAGSAWGKRSTPRSRNEKMPSTTSDMTSIVAKTGRRTLSSASDTWNSEGWNVYLRAGWLVTRAPSTSFSTSVAAMGSPAVDAADDLDALADPIADLDLGRAEPVTLDDEDAVHAVAVLHGGRGHREHAARPGR